MNFNTKQISLVGGVLALPLPREQLENAQQIIREIASGKTMSVEIKQKAKKRSIDANAYLWVLLTEMAAILHTTKEELYKQELIKHGVAITHVIVKPHAVEAFKNQWQGAVKELGPVKANGKDGIQLQCYFGSSTYTSREFSVLLDGVIEDAKELGIVCMSKADRDILLEKWGNYETQF